MTIWIFCSKIDLGDYAW